jgi:hypothetical protein
MDNRPLPLSLVETLFARLAVSYGHPFLNQYEGFAMPVIHQDWADKLAGFGVWGDDGVVRCPAIDWALDNLPAGRPVNALDFRQLCKAYRADTGHPLGLPAPPRAVPSNVRSALAQLAVPLEDKRPERVRVAARCIAKWGCAGVRLNPTQAEWLKHAREVMRRYEGQEQQDKSREAAYAAGHQ